MEKGKNLVEKKFTILIVDDEEYILNSLRRLLYREYKVLTALNADDAYKLLYENNVPLVISDQRMPKVSGTEFLAKVKEEYPDVIRTILSGYTDVDTITELINKGHIYKFFLKPWNDNDLRLEIKQCLDQHELIKKNRELNKIIIKRNKDLEEINEELKRINENLGAIVQKRTKELEIKNQALELSRAIFEDMPLPALCVSEDGIIVMSNKKASCIVSDNICFEIGKNISEYLTDNAKQIFDNAIKNGNSEKLENCSIMGNNYILLIEPLFGKFKGKGATIILV